MFQYTGCNILIPETMLMCHMNKELGNNLYQIAAGYFPFEISGVVKNKSSLPSHRGSSCYTFGDK